MTYSVKLSPHAVRDYKKLAPPIQAQIRTGLDALQRHPLTGAKITRLKGRLHAYSRYRVDQYRIVYMVVQKEQTIYVDYIQHRKDVYRHP